MKIEQYVTAYRVNQDRLRALLPDGFSSLRPVLRINAEVRGEKGYVELNTPVEKDGVRGWLNLDFWEDFPFSRTEDGILFENGFLYLAFSPSGTEGSCPAEKDNAGCYFRAGEDFVLRAPETIMVKKEFCDCRFAWRFSASGAHGQSERKTLPAPFEEPREIFPRKEMTAENAAEIPCEQVLGCYRVLFER